MLRSKMQGFYRSILHVAKVIYPIRFCLFILFVVSFFFALETSLKPYLIKLFINATAIKDPILLSTNLYQIALYIVLIQFFIHLFKRISELCYIKIDLYFKGDVLKNIFNQVLSQDYDFFEKQSTGEISFKINNLAHALQVIIIAGMQFIANILAVTIAFIFLYYVNPLFGIAILTWASFVIIVSFFTLQKTSTNINNLSKAHSLLQGNIIDVLKNIMNVILFNAKNYELKTLETLQEEQKIKIKKYRTDKLRFYSIQGIIFIIYQIFCLHIIIALYINKTISIGDFALIIATNFALLDRLWGLADQMSLFADHWFIAMHATKTFFKHKKLKNQDYHTLKISTGSITFDNVNYSYADSSAKVFFQNQSIHIDGGQKVGLVGYSGGGKSTFINLITRLYEINSGKILIDGQDIRNVTKDSLRNAITAIPQESFLFNRSLIDNIKYDKQEATEIEVMEASQKAYIHDFILTLPEGYKTIIGNNGLRLSGGQQQRILIARAILKNSPILILDEPMSQLDSVTEKNILTYLSQFMERKTVLIIAHRLVTLSFMDRILVFENGRIIEDGSPKELLRKGHVYQKFLITQ